MGSNSISLLIDKGELLATQLTPGNIDDRKPVLELTKHLEGKLYGDKGYIAKSYLKR